ncbi:hypothetical protein AJ80_07639 [Polytolypa hystricis UAMH7299]|uniref:Uncharacterized protein n=1 Tax=Polytolypa hystricis (strain UAMH7299) TaxID=1447883 RepID=A0A2B7XM61_POLH7|nr:hypothetical protein AJ80_07639 [Polytolypa hystricis UAMH7299]
MSPPTTKPIHFFDITSTLPSPRQSWSPNTLRTRLILNYKSIPYTQSFISYPDIKPLLTSLHIPALNDGFLPYTLPAIIHHHHQPSDADSSSKADTTAINDSLPIALYLDHAFPTPQHPSIFPHGPTSISLAIAVQHLISACISRSRALIMPRVWNILDPRGQVYFRESRERGLFGGRRLEDVRPEEGGEEEEAMWMALSGEMEVFVKMLKGDGEGVREGVFFEGGKPGYADFLLVGFLAWFERCDRRMWERMMGLGDGGLRRLWEACEGWVDGMGEDAGWEIS